MQRIIATIGAPRSGKSTFAGTFDPNEWVTVTFDDLRQTLWPPHRRTYWTVREGPNGEQAQKLLHHVKSSAIHFALDCGFSVITPDTHVRKQYAEPLKRLASLHNIDIEWKVLEVPLDVLRERNNKSDENLGHKVPDAILEEMFNILWAPDAWWREESNVEIVKYQG